MTQFDERVSVVMITRNRCAEADRTLTVLGQLPERPRVIVVDNASTDGTARMVRTRHPDVLLIEADTNLASAGRTLGVRAASTPHVAFSDDDSWWRPGSLTHATDLLDAHPTLALVAALILVGDDERVDPVCREMARGPLAAQPDMPGTPVLGFLAGMSVVRADAYLSVGGFDPQVGVGGEEAWLAADLAAAGWHLAYVSDVVAHHMPSISRDPDGRRRTDLRNALWFAWTRRPLPAAVRRTAALVGEAQRDLVTATALGAALRAWPWVRETRRRLPPDVDATLDLLERPTPAPPSAPT